MVSRKEDNQVVSNLLRKLSIIEDDELRYQIRNTLLSINVNLRRKFSSSIRLAIMWSYYEVVYDWAKEFITDSDFEAAFGFNPKTP